MVGIAWAFPEMWKGRYEILLDTAKRLSAEGYHEAAVVTAHTACEVCTEITLSNTLREKGLDHLSKPIDNLLPNHNLGNDRVRKLYESLTGDLISQESFWPNFTTHTKR